MSIRHAVLGFVSWRPFTGYELKKLFSDSRLFHWSGNSNQIYRTLVQLHRDGLVDLEVQQQDSLPPRKQYSITGAGSAELRRWVGSAPELPRVRSTFLVQLAWADVLDPAELDGLLARYEHEVELELLASKERQRRGEVNPARTARESLLWRAVADNQLRAHQTELGWVRELRGELARRAGA